MLTWPKLALTPGKSNLSNFARLLLKPFINYTINCNKYETFIAIATIKHSTLTNMLNIDHSTAAANYNLAKALFY